MDLNTILERLHTSNEFKQWQKENKDFYLAHIFVMHDEANKGAFQIGYYNSNKDKMITFIMTPEEIKLTSEQEVMKAKQTINQLDAEKVKISFETALETAKKCREENYKNELIMKSFFILQELDKIPVFNITYLTHGFKTINIKINATTGEVVKHTIGVIAEFS
ncbi:PepSY domain-containing protein [Candidatus Woesearchaeota archaeon]|nr:PepSY domain-containing protein [Candidatus Woesearchaeota archaeon]